MNDKQFGKGPQQLLNYPHDPPSFPSPSCPRCSSSKTKFCYYNNYSVSQPRYFCKDCRRYWTHGGTIRNIPNNVTNRKRGRATSTSSSSQSSKSASHQGLVVPPALSTTRCMGSREAPKSASSSTSQFLLSQHSGILYPTLAPKAWSTGFPDKPVGGGVDSSIGGGTFRLPINETNQSIIGGGISNQTTFMFSPNGELGVVNNTFGSINAPFVGGAPLQPFPPNSLLHHFSLIGGSYELGMPFLQPSQHQLIPSPSPTAWTTQNMTHSSTNTNANNMIPKARKTTKTNNVISINEWPDFVDMEIEGDPLQSYKSLSP